MIMNRKYATLGIALAALSLTSCGDQLNYNEYSVHDREYIERNFGYVDDFAATIYNNLDSDLGNLGGAMLACATDEAEYSGYNATGNTIADFYNGNWSPANPHLTIWSSAYTGITYCNEFLDNWTGLTFDELKLNADYEQQMFKYNNIQYECRWARAYYYFILVRQYGAVPFKEHNTTGAAETALPCESADKIFAFIDSECDAIKDLIVEDYTNLGAMALSPTQTGRANKFAVLALKAQAALYHASPLFNPNNDPELWHKAAQANKELIDACEAAGKVLAKDYSKLWASDFATNSDVYGENIFVRRPLSANNSMESNNFPVGYSSGHGGNCPTQDLVDAYCMKNGMDINEEGSDYDPQNPYTNRDPRLAMTIAVNGDVWPNDIVNTEYPALETYEGGFHSRTGSSAGASYATPTGYYLKKLLSPTQILRSGHATTSYHPWLTFRLGGMYLNYAEALFQYFKAKGEANAADAVDEEFTVSARALASKTRVRAGLPEFSRALDNEDFWAKYKKERMVELAFEGHRFYDVRRWKEDGDKFMTIHRMQIIKNEDGTFTYKPYSVTRGSGKWDNKWNLFPFSQTEILKSGGAIVQNPGW